MVPAPQMGSESLEAPAITTAAGEPLPPDCDGEIDWTLFTFSHGFRQPRTAVLAVRLLPKLPVPDTVLAIVQKKTKQVVILGFCIGCNALGQDVALLNNYAG